MTSDQGSRIFEDIILHLEWRDQYFLCVVHVLYEQTARKFVWVEAQIYRVEWNLLNACTNASSYCQTYFYLLDSRRDRAQVSYYFLGKALKIVQP